MWYTICLLRKDLFKCTLSHTVAEKLQNFNEHPYAESKILIDENKFLSILESKIEYWNEISKLKTENKIDKIVYFEDFTFNTKTDYRNLNLPLAKKARVEVVMEEKTPYNIINILNIKKLEEIFNKRMTSFSSNSILNKNGILELK